VDWWIGAGVWVGGYVVACGLVDKWWRVDWWIGGGVAKELAGAASRVEQHLC